MFCLTVDDQIELCLPETRHAEALFALTHQNRDYLRQWLPWLDATKSAADTRQFIQTTLEQLAANNGFQTVMLYQAEMVGMVGYHKIDWTNRTTSIGYWLAQEYQGRGIVSRSCRFLVNYAFTELGLNRVEIRCAPDNRKSCAIPERLGFTNEGTIRQAEWLYDHFVDHVIYGMLAETWNNKR